MLIVDIFATRQYFARLSQAGMLNVARRGLGMRALVGRPVGADAACVGNEAWGLRATSGLMREPNVIPSYESCRSPEIKMSVRRVKRP